VYRGGDDAVDEHSVSATGGKRGGLFGEISREEKRKAGLSWESSIQSLHLLIGRGGGKGKKPGRVAGKKKTNFVSRGEGEGHRFPREEKKKESLWPRVAHR